MVMMAIIKVNEEDFFENIITLGYWAFSRPQLDVLNF